MSSTGRPATLSAVERGHLAWWQRPAAWLFWEAPLARVAWLRLAVYAFVVLDVLVLHSTGRFHGAADPVWYQPLVVGQVLGLPAATVLLAELTRWGSVVLALLAMTGRAPRLLGWATVVCWAWFQYIAFSYGKVDHDRAGLLTVLLVLPTVGQARLRDDRRSQAAGFALRAAQLAAISTYFLAAIAKVRFGGWEWVNSATVARAVVRRGTWFSEWMLDYPALLVAAQWGLFTAELLSPVIFVLAVGWQRRVVGAWYLFHAATYAAISIAFWPHLVTLLAFVPLERAAEWVRWRWRRRRGLDEDVPAPPPLVAPGRDG
ncbi:hypothetical protein [Pseudokineococcus sp. 1T1Z-3]|uniref:hypothetical protein n=1 Tax=Pseudokineococcus sp. 1T1Z-3 TaxID=3132745 RepID=UPI0030B0096C